MRRSTTIIQDSNNLTNDLILILRPSNPQTIQNIGAAEGAPPFNDGHSWGHGNVLGINSTAEDPLINNDILDTLSLPSPIESIGVSSNVLETNLNNNSEGEPTVYLTNNLTEHFMQFLSLQNRNILENRHVVETLPLQNRLVPEPLPEYLSIDSTVLANAIPRHTFLSADYLNRLTDITTEYLFTNRRFVYTDIPNIYGGVLRSPVHISDPFIINTQNFFRDIFNRLFEFRNNNNLNITQFFNDLLNNIFNEHTTDVLINHLNTFIHNNSVNFSLSFLMSFIFIMFQNRNNIMPLFRNLINNRAHLTYILTWLSIFSIEIIYNSPNIIINLYNFDSFLVLTQEQLNSFLLNIGLMVDQLTIIFDAAERSNILYLTDEATRNNRIIERQSLIPANNVGYGFNFTRNRLIFGSAFIGVTALGLYWLLRRSSSSSQTTPIIINSTPPTPNINITPHVTITGSTTGWDLLVRLLNHFSR